jgi:hypothetical protein
LSATGKPPAVGLPDAASFSSIFCFNGIQVGALESVTNGQSIEIRAAGIDQYYRAIGAMVALPRLLGMKAEALHLADPTSEALKAINEA